MALRRPPDLKRYDRKTGRWVTQPARRSCCRRWTGPAQTGAPVTETEPDNDGGTEK